MKDQLIVLKENSANIDNLIFNSLKELFKQYHTGESIPQKDIYRWKRDTWFALIEESVNEKGYSPFTIFEIERIFVPSGKPGMMGELDKQIQQRISSEIKRKRRNTRLYSHQLLQESLQELGGVYISIWSRDCDMYESTRFVKFDSLPEFYKFRREQELDAEGPMSISYYDSVEGWEDDKRYYTGDRDRVLEAFENGEYYNV